MMKFFLLLIPVLLSGCVNNTQTKEPPRVKALQYQCDEGPLTVLYDDTEQHVSLHLDGERLMLTKGYASNGLFFSDGVYTYLVYNDSITLYRHDWIIRHHCQLTPA